MTPSYEELRDQLAELIAIPSVSADLHADDVVDAAEWVAGRIRDAGGEADTVSSNGGRPLVIGEVRAGASPETAPTVICYAHFNVQPQTRSTSGSRRLRADRAGRLALRRGVADDKAQLLMLVSAAHQLASGGELPVNVRFAHRLRGGGRGQSIIDWVAADERGADAAIVFDSSMEEPGIPTFNTALRGLCCFHLTVRTNDPGSSFRLRRGRPERDPRPDAGAIGGRREGRAGAEPLRVGVLHPLPRSSRGGSRSPPVRGDSPRSEHDLPDVAAMREYYVHVGEPSVDVHGLAGGSRTSSRRSPVEARASVSIRIASGQNVADVSAAFERLLLEAAPRARTCQPLHSVAEPGLVSPDAPPSGSLGQLSSRSSVSPRCSCASAGRYPWSRASRPAGSRRSRPASPRTTPPHSPNEKFPAEYLTLGVAAVGETARRLGSLVRAPFTSPLAEELAGDVLERFLRYVRVDTQAAYRVPERPSTEKQLELSRLLVQELRDLGLDAELTTGAGLLRALGTNGAPVVGLIAHVDTTPDVSGADVSPIVHQAWDGALIALPGDSRQVLDPKQLPELARSGRARHRHQ